MNPIPLPILPASIAAPAGHARVLFLEIHGGYLDGVCVFFSPHVSCTIGSKGSGKTTLFEMKRFAFGATSLIGKESTKSLLKKNLGTGFVRAGYETAHGVRIVAERRIGEERPRFYTWEGEPVNLGPDLELLEAYGQDEIEKVGEDRASQRKLVDRLAGDAIRPHLVEVTLVTQELRDGARALLALEAEISALESSAAEARAIEEQLKPLLAGTGNDAAILTQGHAAKARRGREKQAMVVADAVLTETRATVERLTTTLATKLAGVLADDLRTGANGALLTELDAGLTTLRATLTALGSTVTRTAEGVHGSLAGWRTELAVAHAAQDADYDALVARQEEDEGRTRERARLQERLSVVAAAVPQLEEKTRTHAGLRRAQDAMAERLLEARDQRSAARTAVKARHEATLDKDGVRMKIEVDKQLDAYRTLLKEVLAPITGGQPKWLVDKIAPAIRPDELVAIVRKQDRAALIERAGLMKHAERAAQTIAALTPNEQLYALQSVEIDDEVILETKHGKVWKDTVECSPGQRSGAILPLLLLGGDIPLAIDQPDDNVDPAFMCDAILPRIVAMRGSRQFMFVTHHANVPVISESEQVVLIESNGSSAGIQAEGGIPPMKGYLLSKLEGGKQAFARRKETYDDVPATPPTESEKPT